MEFMITLLLELVMELPKETTMFLKTVETLEIQEQKVRSSKWIIVESEIL